MFEDTIFRELLKRKNYEDSWDARAMPSFFIRLRRVLGWRSRILAAPR